MKGYMARSKAGHDLDQIYVIIEETEEFVFLADGKYKTVKSPKKKRKKHIQIIKKSTDTVLYDKIINGECIQDTEIKKAIKDFLKEEINV